MTPLDRIIGLETQREILSILTPKQLLMIALRWDGLNNRQIAHTLHTSEELVSYHICRARKRILQHLPELEPATRGRYFASAKTGSLPTDDWLLRTDNDN